MSNIHVILRDQDGVTKVAEGRISLAVVNEHPILYWFGHYFLMEKRRPRSIVYRKCVDPFAITEFEL
ncbi:hypothetical protein EVB91_212 [Rhizobium phage RHph_I1_18]|nr:hypothetical protein EVB91_212 [Rhizobium phage RHph_I1_18]